MSYFIIGRRPINDTMERGSDREVSPAVPGGQPDTRMLEAAQRQLDTLRSTMDARLADLQIALTDPNQAATLPALVMELSRLATSEAHATAARMCMQLRHDGEAALAEAETRHALSIETQRQTVREHQRALDSARQRIEQLEADHLAATRNAEQQTRALQAEQAARAELDRTAATLERQLQSAAAQLADATALARERADELSRVYEDAATLRDQVDELTAKLATQQAGLEALGHDKTSEHEALSAARAALEDARAHIDVERQATAVATSKLANLQARVSGLERALEDAKARASTSAAAAQTQRDLAAAVDRSAQLQHQLDEALLRLEQEQVIAQDASAAHAEAAARITVLEAQVAGLERAQEEAAQRQLPDVKARIEKDREFERTLEELSGLTVRLDAERATADQLREELANLESQLHGEQRTVAMLREALADAEQARREHAEVLRAREAERACFAELQRANDALSAELALERTAFAELTAQSVASSQKQEAIGADLERVTATTAGLESALSDERARTAAYRSIEEELREQVTRAAAETKATRLELADTRQALESVERARIEAQQRVARLEDSLAAASQEQATLRAALATERATCATVHDALATAEHRLADAYAVADALRLELESSTPVATAPSATVGRLARPSTMMRSMSWVLPSWATTSTIRSYQRKVARLS